MEDIIQILDDHIAVSPNPAQQDPSEKETDSGLEEILTPEEEESESENESDNPGIEVVGSASSDQEEVTVGPASTETRGTAPEEGTPELAPETDNPADKDEHGQSDELEENGEKGVANENNNNKEKSKVMLEMPTNRSQSANPPGQQIVLHKVPIRFPVPGNLMESMETLMFINEALISLFSDLPSDAVIDDTPLNRVDSHHARTPVVITFDSELTRNQILKKAREREADHSIPKENKFYFTEMPRRSRPRLQTHTDDEVQEMREEARETMRPKVTTRDKMKKCPKVKSVAVPRGRQNKEKVSATHQGRKNTSRK